MMAGNEGDLLGEGSREERRVSQGEVRLGGKDNSHRGTPSKKGKEKGESPVVEAEKATTPPAIDSGTSRLPATPKATKACDGLWSLRERMLGWFDPEGTPKAREKHRDTKEGEGASSVGETESSEGGLKKIVVTLTRALNKNQGYLADAKKKLAFDGANITEFLIDYENLAALLKWIEEEKMDHLGQHVSLSLGRDIMAIVASSGSWKETRNEMMRKYLQTEKMATEAELAVVQTKNYATYNDFLRAFTLVTLRISGLTDRIMKAELVADIAWDQPRGRGPQVNFILEGNGQDRVNITTRRAGAEKKLIRDMVMEKVVELAQIKADLLAESHARRSIYSLRDLYSGYDQLPLDVRDRPYTAMHTPVGQLQMQVTPMGFTNAVAEAQRRMFAVAGGMFQEKCEPYIDDNPIKGAQNKDETEVQPGIRKFVWDHLQDIKDLLQRFLVYNITASRPKSILAFPEVTILGFRCGAYGRKPDPEKTNKISQSSTPLRTTTEVRTFLGVVGFWRIFIKEFAKVAEPIRAMIREGGTMEWTEDRKAAVQTLKDILSSDQVTLAAPCFNDEVGRPFILETDGGPLAVGGVLIQRSEEGKERPIRFESRTLKSAERRYSQFRKEVLAILHCLKTFQAHLFKRRFILRIDPTNVAGALKNYKPIDSTIGRWIGFIWQFDYKVERIAGLRNRADGVSRVCITPEGIEDAEPIDVFLEYEGGTLVVDNEMVDAAPTMDQLLIQTLEKGASAVVAELKEGPVTTIRRKDEKDSWRATIGPKEELMVIVIEGGRDAVMNLMYDDIFREIDMLLIGNNQPMEVSLKAREEAEKYVLRNGHLFKKEEGMMSRQVVCGRSRQLDIIQTMHDGLAGGHRSSKGTLAIIAPLYFWPGMAGMVAMYCQACLICQERSSARVFEPLRPTRVLGPGHLVHLDLAVMLVSTDGYRYILDARDNLSGYVEAVALKRKTRKRVADWVEDFYLRHPFVRKFIADNETKFVNHEVLSRLKTLCVPIKIIEPYHPEANAPVKKGHQTLKNTIAKLAVDDQGNWARYLKQVVFSENMTPKRTTGCIPAELWYEREIDFPVEALVPTWNRLDDNPHMSTEELIVARCRQVVRNEEALEDVVKRVMDNRMKDKARWDQVKNIRKEPLQVGESVLVRNSALESTWSEQLGKRFKGPYRIAKRVRVDTFELEDLDGTRIKGSFPGQRLVRFLSRDPVEQWLQEARDKETGELTT
ncbi:hypothetical protein CBR_g55878 [Chara braunii]|uniref:Integrase catalytic domain-containing protein n=1 Tax=Chara braunii TaxID=69332 RepID=A0A388MDG0_CHABU|nr:hypothetical protein CBR_g55878 [Chara braunii]|eukprot:GBG92543.1 hypothetical protein CBR_g55878 [Chara braunii]